MSLPFCPSAGAARPFPPSADGEIPQPGYGVLHSQLDCTVERLLWNGLPPRYGVALPRLVCTGERLPWNGLPPGCGVALPRLVCTGWPYGRERKI